MSEGVRGAAKLREITDAAILAKTRFEDQRYERMLLKLDKELVNAAQEGRYTYDLKWFRVCEDDGELDHTDLSRILMHLEARGLRISIDNRVVSWKEESENKKT
jgi:hypothetical protein